MDVKRLYWVVIKIQDKILGVEGSWYKSIERILWALGWNINHWPQLKKPACW